MDTEWKAEILRKLDSLSELSGLRKDVRRIAVALEKLAGIEGEDSDEERISWPESEAELTEVQGSKDEGKQKEKKIDGTEEEGEVGGQEEGSTFSPVAYSVGTGIL